MRIEPVQDPRNTGRDNDNDRDKDVGWRTKRVIDLGSILVLLGVMVAGDYYFNRPAPPTQTSFIVPSQHVHW